MILLDTNVMLEPLRHTPEAHVIEWIDAQPLETLYLSVITVAELRAGVAIDTADGYIAASAVVSGFTVATGDTSPLRVAGLEVIKPWD